jgi:hypothetical protein
MCLCLYLDVHVVGFYVLFSACFVEPNGRDSLVQLPFGDARYRKPKKLILMFLTVFFV